MEKNNLNGVIVLNKNKKFTSNDCLAVIKKELHPKKIGHTGTLDPNATGVLVCLLGSATKCQDYLMSCGNKIYEAELILGIETDTEDFTGKTIAGEYFDYDNIKYIDFNCDTTIYENVLNSFKGKYLQVPPMYSSKKINGKKYINFARKGINIERKPCELHINDIKLNKINKIILNSYSNDKNNIINTKELICLNINVECSKGTYIRTLCKDIGEKLNEKACMGNLKRIKSGEFDIKESYTLDDIKNKIKNDDLSFIKPCYYQQKENVITFGKFETLHLGHQEIIKEVVKNSKLENCGSIAMIINSGNLNNFITKEQRISKLKYLGIDKILEFELNKYNKNIEAIDFINEILIKQLKAKIIVVGSDCRFGKDGKGDIELLKEFAKKNEVKVISLEKLKIAGTNKDISSTYIKEQYEKGNNEIVKELLGK